MGRTKKSVVEIDENMLTTKNSKRIYIYEKKAYDKIGYFRYTIKHREKVPDIIHCLVWL